MSEEEDQDVQEEAYSEALKRQMVDESTSREVYDDTAIKNKLIEPDDRLNDELALSNFQLGNITESDYYANLHEVNFALDCIDMPFEEGGWFLNDQGYKTFRRLDIAHIMSGSKKAKKWDSLTQDKKINVLQKQSTASGGFGSMFKRK